MDYPSPEENSLIYQSNIWLLKPWLTWQQTIKPQLSSLKTSQGCYYPNYWLAEVDHEDKNANKSEDMNDDEQYQHKDYI